jgi:hypothetical protein
MAPEEDHSDSGIEKYSDKFLNEKGEPIFSSINKRVLENNEKILTTRLKSRIFFEDLESMRKIPSWHPVPVGVLMCAGTSHFLVSNVKPKTESSFPF